MRLRSATVFNVRSLIIAVVLGFTGCFPTSEHPLSDPKQAQVDSRLIGTWERNDHIGNTQIRIRRIRDTDPATKLGNAKVMVMDDEAPTKNAAARREFYRCFVTRASGHEFLNVYYEIQGDVENLPKEQKALDTGFYICKLNVTGDTLTLWPMDPNKVNALIASGELKGKKSDRGSRIRESSERLTSLIMKYADSKELFPESTAVRYLRANR